MLGVHCAVLRQISSPVSSFHNSPEMHAGAWQWKAAYISRNLPSSSFSIRSGSPQALLSPLTMQPLPRAKMSRPVNFDRISWVQSSFGVFGSRQLALLLGTSYSLLVASVDHHVRNRFVWSE